MPPDFGTDALRWCSPASWAVADSDFTTKRLISRANENLAGLGNVTNRVVSPINRHRGGLHPLRVTAEPSMPSEP